MTLSTLYIQPLDISYSVNPALFASPVGWAMGVGATLLLYVVEKEWGERRLVRFLRSARMATWLLGLTALYCVLGGSLPSWSRFYTTWPFILLLTLLLAHLALVVIHRLRKFSLQRDGAFVLTHGGLWLALFSGMVGAGDMRELQAVVDTRQETTFALDRKRARMVPLGYSLRLKEFVTEQNEADGSPVQYAATVWVDGKLQRIAVNAPLAVSWDEDLYLLNFDRSTGSQVVTSCLLQVVRQPWKHVTLAGIALLMTGTLWMLTKRRRKEVGRC